MGFVRTKESRSSPHSPHPRGWLKISSSRRWGMSQQGVQAEHRPANDGENNQRKFIYHHVKKLMYTVRVGTPDPRFGNMLLEQFGGANGELAAAMQYSIQGLREV